MCSGFVWTIEPNNGYELFPLLYPNTSEACVDCGCDFPLVFPALGTELMYIVIKVFHCIHGHSNHLMLRDTTRSFGVDLAAKLKVGTGCSMAKW